MMERDEVSLLLIARTVQHGGIGSAYFYVRDVDGLHAERAAAPTCRASRSASRGACVSSACSIPIAIA